MLLLVYMKKFLFSFGFLFLFGLAFVSYQVQSATLNELVKDYDISDSSSLLDKNFSYVRPTLVEVCILDRSCYITDYVVRKDLCIEFNTQLNHVISCGFPYTTSEAIEFTNSSNVSDIVVSPIKTIFVDETLSTTTTL